MLDLRNAPSKVYTSTLKQAHFDTIQMILTSGTDVEYSVLESLTAPKHVNTRRDTRRISSINNMAEAENLAWSMLYDCFADNLDPARDNYERFAEYLFAIGGAWRLTAHNIYEWLNDIEALAVPDTLFDEHGDAWATRVIEVGGKPAYVVAEKKEALSVTA